jgi:hypothetical protein
MPNIRGSVGMYAGKQCYNFRTDQHTVQDLLNRIPEAKGGAGGSLKDPIVDRKISRNLLDAILRFQRANRCVTDGHVDPDQQTIRLLNQIVAETPKPIAPPAPAPPPERTSTRFALHSRTDKAGTAVNDWLFEVIDLINNRDAVYLFSYAGANPGPIPLKFDGRLSVFNTRGPEVLTRLDCDGVFGTFDHGQGPHSLLVLALPTGSIQINMWWNLFDAADGTSAGASQSFSARFQFVR